LAAANGRLAFRHGTSETRADERHKDRNDLNSIPMKKSASLLTGLLTACAILFAVTGRGQDQPSAAPAKPAAPAAKPSQEELEAAFKATLTQATFTGRWCGIKDGRLTPEKEDKYTIVGVSKIGGEAWIINARIQYGTKDFMAPIPVFVKWAGDTPVITLDNVGLPGGNTYSARVLIHKNTYAGTWSGGDHAGLLNGLITTATDKPAAP
jgi:hypothetical protein